MDKRGLRLIALEILATDNSEVVKMAGLWRRFKNWWKGFRDSNYKEEIAKLKDSNQEAITLSREIDNHLAEMTSAIKDGDVAAYTDASNKAKDVMLKLTQIISDNNDVAQPMLTDAFQKAKEQGMLSSLKPEGNDVEWEKRYKDRPLRSFEWYSNIPNQLQMSAKTRESLVGKAKEALVNAGIQAVNDDPSFFKSFQNAVVGGNLLYAKHREPANKGSLAVKTKKGDSTILVLTDVVRFDGHLLQFEILLNDTGRSHHGARSDSRLALVRTVKANVVEKRQEQKPAVPKEVRPPTEDEVLSGLSAEEQARLEEAQYKAQQEQAEQEWRAESEEPQYELASSFSDIIKEAGVDPNASKHLPESFWQKFVEMSGRLNAKPEDIAKVINAESAFDPGAINIQGGRAVAKGLSQFTLITLPAIGMSRNQWDTMESMSAENQLDFIERYFRGASRMGGIDKWEDATQLYVANFAPTFLNKPNAPFYEEGSVAYAMNQGLDRDRKGYITAKDLSISVAGPLPEHILTSINKAKESLGQASTTPSDGVGDLTNTLMGAYAAGPLEKLVKKIILSRFLPESDVLVVIKKGSFADKVEYARVTSNILRKFADAKVSICANNDSVELQIVARGSLDKLTPTIKGLCELISNAMERATSIKVLAIVMPGLVSKHAELHVDNILRNHRIFNLQRMVRNG